MPPSPAPSLAPPPEGIFRSFEDLLNSVQRLAKNEGYGIVKLRASNYREGKPTRYDLVCDRGGVKYASTAKKRNPSTRKVDCPWRAKAVCEVQLNNQWRFAVQESRHNHEARVATPAQVQESTAAAQSMRSLVNKLDRMNHDITHSFSRMEGMIQNLEKRLDSLEQGGRVGMIGGSGPPMNPSGLGAPSIGAPNMGPGSIGNGGMPNGGIGPSIDSHRLNNMEARVSALEQQRMEMPMDDVESRLLASSVI